MRAAEIAATPNPWATGSNEDVCLVARGGMSAPRPLLELAEPRAAVMALDTQTQTDWESLARVKQSSAVVRAAAGPSTPLVGGGAVTRRPARRLPLSRRLLWRTALSAAARLQIGLKRGVIAQPLLSPLVVVLAGAREQGCGDEGVIKSPAAVVAGDRLPGPARRP